MIGGAGEDAGKPENAAAQATGDEDVLERHRACRADLLVSISVGR